MGQNLRAEMAGIRTDLTTTEQRLRTGLTTTEQRLQSAIEALGLRLTIRLGVMIGTATAALAAILRLH
jgi:hypothetical protein